VRQTVPRTVLSAKRIKKASLFTAFYFYSLVGNLFEIYSTNKIYCTNSFLAWRS